MELRRIRAKFAAVASESRVIEDIARSFTRLQLLKVK
jgi:hypothetical protein